MKAGEWFNGQTLSMCFKIFWLRFNKESKRKSLNVNHNYYIIIDSHVFSPTTFRGTWLQLMTNWNQIRTLLDNCLISGLGEESKLINQWTLQADCSQYSTKILIISLHQLFWSIEFSSISGLRRWTLSHFSITLLILVKISSLGCWLIPVTNLHTRKCQR